MSCHMKEIQTPSKIKKERNTTLRGGMWIEYSPHYGLTPTLDSLMKGIELKFTFK